MPLTPFEQKEHLLQEMLDDEQVAFFAAKELLTLGGSHYVRGSACYGLNRLPPDSFLQNIVPAAKALDKARIELGSPVIVTCAYRAPKYNACVGGESKSFHMRFFAIDATPRDPSKLAKFKAILKRQRAEGVWTGGLGLYRTFVHVDCGTSFNRSW